MTWRFILIVVAALLAGAFVTTNTAQRGSVRQIVRLSTSVIFVIVSRFVSVHPVYIMGQQWLFLYAGAALLCALVIRFSLEPKKER